MMVGESMGASTEWAGWAVGMSHVPTLEIIWVGIAHPGFSFLVNSLGEDCMPNCPLPSLDLSSVLW